MTEIMFRFILNNAKYKQNISLLNTWNKKILVILLLFVQNIYIMYCLKWNKNHFLFKNPQKKIFWGCKNVIIILINVTPFTKPRFESSTIFTQCHAIIYYICTLEFFFGYMSIQTDRLSRGIQVLAVASHCTYFEEDRFGIF